VTAAATSTATSSAAPRVPQLGNAPSSPDLAVGSSSVVTARSLTRPPPGAEGFKFKEGKPGPLQFDIALPKEQGSGDFIGTLRGKGIGWSAVSLGAGMLGNILVGVQFPTDKPEGGLYFAEAYGPPDPLQRPNVTLKTIERESYGKRNEWKYTFLCQGCLAPEQTAGRLTVGWAYHTGQKVFRGKHNRNGENEVDLNSARTDGFRAFIQ